MLSATNTQNGSEGTRSQLIQTKQPLSANRITHGSRSPTGLKELLKFDQKPVVTGQARLNMQYDSYFSPKNANMQLSTPNGAGGLTNGAYPGGGFSEARQLNTTKNGVRRKITGTTLDHLDGQNSRRNLPSDMVLFDRSKEKPLERLDDGQFMKTNLERNKKSIYSASFSDGYSN